VGDAVGHHQRDDPGIMDLLTPDGVGDDQPPPDRVCDGQLGQEREPGLDGPQPPVGLGGVEPPPTPSHGRAGAYIPEFDCVLHSDRQPVTSAPDGPDRVVNGPVLRVGGVGQPEQDAGVGQDEHQSWSS
jgi:hypothetical protein